MYEQFDVLVYVINVLLKCDNTILLLHSVYFTERCNTIVLFMYSPKYSKCCKNKNCLCVYPVGLKVSEKFEKKDLSGIKLKENVYLRIYICFIAYKQLSWLLTQKYRIREI
jgi:hypothetical protein